MLLPDAVVRASGPPDAAQVRDGQDGAGTEAAHKGPVGGVPISGAAAVTFPLLNLSPGTGYQLFLILSSTVAGTRPSVEPASFTTEGFSVSISQIEQDALTSTAASVTFRTNVSGCVLLGGDGLGHGASEAL